MSTRKEADAVREADPALAEELELFDELMDAGTRERFWRAFAEESRRVVRPAQAVLPALERAAAGRGGRRPTTRD